MNKALFIIILCIISVSNRAKAQATTLEEWNYMTKGYEIQINSGLDMKRGYYIDNFTTFQQQAGSSIYKFNFKLLRRNSDKSLAGTMIEYQRKQDGIIKFSRYFCIPAVATGYEVEQLALSQFNNIDSFDFMKAYSFALTKYSLDLERLLIIKKSAK